MSLTEIDEMGNALDTETPTPADAVPQAVEDKFAEVFGRLSAADAAEAGIEIGDTESPDSSGKIRGERQQQQDELLQEGHVSPDDPDGVGETTVEPGEETDNEDADEQEVARPADEAEPVALDPNLRFAAQQLGWTNEKIDAFAKADPELAEATFNTLAETYTNLSRQLIPPPGTQAPLGFPAEQATPAQSASPTSQLDRLYANLAEFAEANGEDIVEKFLKPLKAEVIDPIQRMFADVQVQKTEVLKAEARQTLTELTKTFGDVYGVEGKPPSQEQAQTRAYLGQLADQIREASRIQGRELSVKDALNRAHMLVTADRRERAVRTQLKEQVQKRSNSITAKPTQRRDPKLVAAKSDAKAAEAVGRFWADKGVVTD